VRFGLFQISAAPSRSQPAGSVAGTGALLRTGITAACAASLALLPASAMASIGPHAARCDAGQTAVIVNVTGFRVRTGNLRVQLYAANPRTFLERGQYLLRVDVPVTRTGDMPVCMPASAAGRYAISVRHDANGDGRNDRGDGGGFSGNPNVSLLDMALRRKPSLSRVAFDVGATPARVNVVLNYVQGTRFAPVAQR
jgi:uncharacterized protein (DUF2141 family)